MKKIVSPSLYLFLFLITFIISACTKLASDFDESFYFLADYHAIIKNSDSNAVGQSVEDIALAWLSCGLDTNKSFFYRQSDVPEICLLYTSPSPRD